MKIVKSFLVIEKGLIKEGIFPLEVRVTIGRSRGNDIHLPDTSVSSDLLRLACS